MFFESRQILVLLMTLVRSHQESAWLHLPVQDPTLKATVSSLSPQEWALQIMSSSWPPQIEPMFWTML
jgi:hypothetical protein